MMDLLYDRELPYDDTDWIAFGVSLSGSPADGKHVLKHDAGISFKSGA